MNARPAPRRTLSLRGGAAAAALVALVAVAGAPSPATAEIVPGELRFEPRGLDVAKLCKPWVYEPPSRDWTTWQGEDPGVPLLVMIEDADRLMTINPVRPVDAPTAKRLLEYVIAQDRPEAPRARRLLGEILIDDKLDPDAAVRGIAMLDKALDEGQVSAALVLAGVYEQGGPVQADLNRAEELYRRAIAGGSGRAALRVSRLYRSGAVASPEPEAAERYWKLGMTMEMSDIAAGLCNELQVIGAAYLDDFAVYRDAVLARDWLEASVDSKTYRASQSASALARRYMTGDESPVDVPAAAVLLDFSSSRGNLQATHELGSMLIEGRGIPADLGRAAEVFDRGVLLDDGFSMLQRGRIARGDFGGTPDTALALELFLRATKLPQPLPEAFVELGRMYAEGLGVPPDPKAAERYFDSAISLGDPASMMRLARAFRLGDGVTPDIRTAIRLYRQAAYLGRTDAVETLVDIYRCGLGIEPDTALADTWRDRAVAAGSTRFLREVAEEAMADPSGGPAKRFRALREAAVHGNRRAMVLVSFAYQRGIGTIADPRRAALWLEKATAPGPEAAQGYAAIADAYLDGTAGPADPARALQYLEAGAATGDAAAKYALGSFLLSDRAGRLRDPTRALSLIRDAAVAGIRDAARRYARLVSEGVEGGELTTAEIIVEASQKSAADESVTGARVQRSAAELLSELARLEIEAGCNAGELLDLADAYASLSDAVPEAREKASVAYTRAERAAIGDPAALYRVANAIRSGRVPGVEPGRAAELLRRAATAGYAPAMKSLAEVLLAGDGVAADPVQAIDWYERAADAGDGSAAADLFALLVIAPDVPEARRAAAWRRLTAAAEAGSPQAMREVGIRLQIGAGVPADPRTGFSWLERAAEAGDRQAMREIARSYASGFGVAQSNERGLAWLEKAAALGEPRAMYELAIAYQSGLTGAPDPERAKALLDAAARAGYAP